MKLPYRYNKLKMRQCLTGYLFALPSLTGFAVFFLIPFVISLYYCFTEGIGGIRFVGLSNFAGLMKSESFQLAARNTLVFNLISVPLVMLLSFTFALLLLNKLAGLTWFRSIFILPLVIPVASVILVWNILFNEYGVVNHFLAGIDQGPVDWMGSDWSMGILVLLYLWKNCGYNVVLFLSSLNSIPREYYESARIDGAGPWSCLTRITLPFLIPAGFFVFIVSIINSFKVFREAYLLAGSYPHLRIYMLQHFMNNNFLNLSYQRLTTAAFIMAMVILLLVFSLFRLEEKFGRDI